MDLSRYRDLFVSGARNHLAEFGDLLLLYNNGVDDPAVINQLFRHTHSLKGMAATMGYEAFAGLAHLMEDQLSRVRSGEFSLTRKLAELLLEGSDSLERMVSSVEADEDLHEDLSALTNRLATFDPAGAETASSENGSSNETPPTREQESLHQFRHADTFKNIRIKTETLDRLVSITGELLTSRHHLADSIQRAGAEECKEPLRQISLLLKSLRDEVLKARMLPFSIIAERFPRLVHDLARKQEKDISFIMDGTAIELDRSVLEEIAEPLVHILRNAIDHGMEPSDERKGSGKPPEGTIRLSLVRERDMVEITITDDGRGMNPEMLKSRCLEKGIITGAQAADMSDNDAFQLVCKPGFSTAEEVSDVSGRGVGMDAVNTSVRSLSGTLAIRSQAGKGSRFIIRLPITVSIIHVLTVRSGNCEIAFPLTAVSRTFDLNRSDIISEGKRSSTLLEEGVVLYRNLRQILSIPEQPCRCDTIPTLLCSFGEDLCAFGVDSIIGQQEVFVRPLGRPLSGIKEIGGATIRGDGSVLFLADAASLARL